MYEKEKWILKNRQVVFISSGEEIVIEIEWNDSIEIIKLKDY